jgi:transcriptional regulator with XRE-family HTH domain
VGDARTQLIQGYIGANVRRRRLRLALTQEGLAEAAGVDPRYLQEVERGRANLSISVLVALAAALGVDERFLLRRAVLPPARSGRPKASRGG